MNDKSLNFAQLEELFQKFDDFENVNNVYFLGKVSPSPRKKKVNSKAKRNPNFRSLWDIDKQEYVRTCRVVLDFPSITGRIQHGKASVSRVATFTTNAQLIEGLFTAFRQSEKKPQYVIGTGHLQNYKTVSSEAINEEAINFIKDIADRYDLNQEQTNRIFELLNLNTTLSNNDEDGHRNYIPQNVIWTSVLGDGGKAAKQRAERGEPPYINHVTLQGLVYMPPVFHSGYEVDGDDMVQFKVRVRRFIDNHGTDNEPVTDFVPLGFQTEDGYDYFDVVGHGKQAREWFGKVKQGYPVRVVGSIEVTPITRTVHLSYRTQRGIEGVLRCDPGEDFWKRFKDFFDKENLIKRQYPLCTVHASEIVTEF